MSNSVSILAFVAFVIATMFTLATTAIANPPVEQVDDGYHDIVYNPTETPIPTATPTATPTLTPVIETVLVESTVAPTATPIPATPEPTVTPTPTPAIDIATWRYQLLAICREWRDIKYYGNKLGTVVVGTPLDDYAQSVRRYGIEVRKLIRSVEEHIGKRVVEEGCR